MVFDKLDSFASDAVRNVLVFPQSLLAAFHIPDTGNTVYDRHVMPVVRARFELRQQFRMVFSQRFAGKRLLVADGNRIVRIEVDDPLVLYENAGDTVGGSRHQVGIIETDILRSGSDKAVPVLRAGLVAQSQMPLPDRTGRIAAFAEHIGDGRLFGTDHHSGIAGSNSRIIPWPGIMPGKARRRTGSRHRMRIRKTDALCRKLFHIRRMNRFRSVTTQVAITDIIGYQENNVRLLLLRYFLFRFLFVSGTGGQQGGSYS